MSVRRKTHRRLLLLRTCGTCGKSFTTSAASPWVRQLPRDGKRQATTYFCSQSCYRASYKYQMDGLADARRQEREAKRDIKEKNRKYYEAHREQELARQKEKYWADPEAARAANRYSRMKRKAAVL